MASATIIKSQVSNDTIDAALGAALEYLKCDDRGFYGNAMRTDALRLVYNFDAWEVDTAGFSAVVTSILAHDNLLREVMLSRVEKALPVSEMWKSAIDDEGRPKMDYRLRRDAFVEAVADFLVRNEIYHAIMTSNYALKQRVRSIVMFLADYYEWARDAVRATA